MWKRKKDAMRVRRRAGPRKDERRAKEDKKCNRPRVLSAAGPCMAMHADITTEPCAYHPSLFSRAPTRGAEEGEGGRRSAVHLKITIPHNVAAVMLA